MKKMTSVLLGLSGSLLLITTSAIAGQAHMTADSSGREYYSMPQEVQTVQEAKKISISVGSEIVQIEMLANGKINLLFVGEHKFKTEFKKDILGQPNMLVAQTNRHSVILSFGAALKQVGGIQGILDHMIDLGVDVNHKYLSMMTDDNDDLALVLMNKESKILGVQSMNISK